MRNPKSGNSLGVMELQEEDLENGIMIVDDSRFSRNVLSDILKSEGFQVIAEAKNGLEAIEMTKEKNPKYIFLDVEMPMLDGLGALPKLLEINPNVHVIMCTAMGQKNIIVEAAKAGAKDYVLKPYKKENIIRVLSVIIDSEAQKRAKLNSSGKDKQVKTILKETSVFDKNEQDNQIAGKMYESTNKRTNIQTSDERVIKYKGELPEMLQPDMGTAVNIEHLDISQVEGGVKAAVNEKIPETLWTQDASQSFVQEEFPEKAAVVIECRPEEDRRQETLHNEQEWKDSSKSEFLPKPLLSAEELEVDTKEDVPLGEEPIETLDTDTETETAIVEFMCMIENKSESETLKSNVHKDLEQSQEMISDATTEFIKAKEEVAAAAESVFVDNKSSEETEETEETEEIKQEELKQEELKQEEVIQEEVKLDEILKEEILKREIQKEEILKKENLQEKIKQEEIKQEEINQKDIKQEKVNQEEILLKADIEKTYAKEAAVPSENEWNTTNKQTEKQKQVETLTDVEIIDELEANIHKTDIAPSTEINPIENVVDQVENEIQQPFHSDDISKGMKREVCDLFDSDEEAEAFAQEIIKLLQMDKEEDVVVDFFHTSDQNEKQVAVTLEVVQEDCTNKLQEQKKEETIDNNEESKTNVAEGDITEILIPEIETLNDTRIDTEKNVSDGCLTFCDELNPESVTEKEVITEIDDLTTLQKTIGIEELIGAIELAEEIITDKIEKTKAQRPWVETRISAFSEEEYPEDIPDTYRFTYLWEGRFDSNNNHIELHNQAEQGLIFRNMVHVENSVNHEAEYNSNREIVAGLINAYLNYGSRLQPQENVEKQNYVNQEVTRLFAGNILDDKDGDELEITMADMLVKGNNQGRNQIFIQKAGFSKVMRQLVKGKADRVLDRVYQVL